jgi:hypothetical protein
MSGIAALVASDAEWRDEFQGMTEVDRRKTSEVNLLPKLTRTEAMFAAAARARRAVLGLVGGWTSSSKPPREGFEQR